MISDFVLVTLLLVCLTLLTRRKKEWLSGLVQNSLVSGMLLSAIQMMMLAGLLEKTDSTEPILSVFLVKLIIRLRPLMIGLIYKFIFQIVNQIIEKKQKKENEGGQVENPSRAGALGNTFDFSLLSRREIEVARLAAKGYTNAQIAESLFISTETVKCHMNSIFEKLGILSRKELMNQRGDTSIDS